MDAITMLKADTMTDEQIVAGTLQWVNTMRAKHDLPALEALPSGRHGDPGDCALARALAATSDRSCTVPPVSRYDYASKEPAATWTYALGGQVVRVGAPAIVGEFIFRFDLGQLDDLLS